MVPDAVLGLRTQVAAVAELDLALLTDADLLGTTAAVLAQAEALRHVSLCLIAEVDRRHAHREVGAASVSRWLGAQGVDAAGPQVTAARRLVLFPLVAEALADGRLAAAAGRVLQGALAGLRPHLDRPDGCIDGQDGEQALAGVLGDGVLSVVAQARGGFADAAAEAGVDPAAALQRQAIEVLRRPVGQLARVEAALLLVAAHVEPQQLAGAVGALADALLPAQLAEREERARERRSLSLQWQQDSSRWSLRGELDPLCGERLHTWLGAALTSDHSPADTGLAADLRGQGLDPYDPDTVDGLPTSLRPRSRRERLHDALSSGLARLLASDTAAQTRDRQPVQVVVTVTAAALDAVPGALPGRTASGARVSATTVRSWACGSALTRQVLGLAGRVLAISHSGRTISRAERRALHTQTGGVCQGAGCTRSTAVPGAVLHPHHASPWASTGTTSLEDTVLACDGCHAHVHAGGVLRLKDGRRLGPDGWLPPLRT